MPKTIKPNVLPADESNVAAEANIREVELRDLPNILEWRNHADIRQYMLNQHLILKKEHLNWYERATSDSKRHLLIVEFGPETPIGFVQFSKAESGDVADWGFYKAPKAPKGSGVSLGFRALKYGFEELLLHKICGQALDSNHPSIDFHLRMGFQQEGILRDHWLQGNKYHSLVCFGLLENEWGGISEARGEGQ